jgi:mannose-6-phosphate isomerase-like protein (cupin superfamily)
MWSGQSPAMMDAWGSTCFIVCLSGRGSTVKGRVTVTEVSGQTVQPFLGELDEQDMCWFLGERTWLRATTAQTGGALGFVEQVIPFGFASPYHVHHNEDESFCVVEGEVRFVSNGQSWVLEASPSCRERSRMASGWRATYHPGFSSSPRQPASRASSPP